MIGKWTAYKENVHPAPFCTTFEKKEDGLSFMENQEFIETRKQDIAKAKV